MISFKNFSAALDEAAGDITDDRLDEVFGKFFGRDPDKFKDEKKKNNFLKVKSDLEKKKEALELKKKEQKEKREEAWEKARQRAGQQTTAGKRDEYAMHRQLGV